MEHSKSMGSMYGSATKPSKPVAWGWKGPKQEGIKSYEKQLSEMGKTKKVYGK